MPETDPRDAVVDALLASLGATANRSKLSEELFAWYPANRPPTTRRETPLTVGEIADAVLPIVQAHAAAEVERVRASLVAAIHRVENIDQAGDVGWHAACVNLAEELHEDLAAGRDGIAQARAEGAAEVAEWRGRFCDAGLHLRTHRSDGRCWACDRDARRAACPHEGEPVPGMAVLGPVWDCRTCGKRLGEYDGLTYSEVRARIAAGGEQRG